ncbi:SatD family protein, partial [Jeotgalibaca porci]
MYLAIIGNIKNAKAINQHERQKAHSLLSNSLRYINKKYPNRIVAQFTLTIGDEFQGLLKSGTNLFEIMDTISLTMKTIGVDLYFGIGVG